MKVISNTVQEFNGERFYLSGKKFSNRTKRSLHRVVWEHHFGAIPKGYFIHHKNGNRSDNDIENLEMVSKRIFTEICMICDKPLTQGEINNGIVRCAYCTAIIPLRKKVEDDNLKKNFKKEWPVRLIKRYYSFLSEYNFSVETQNRYLNKVIAVLRVAEEQVDTETEITLDWLTSHFPGSNGVGQANFIAFLEKERILPVLIISEDDLMIESIEKLIDRIPENFRRLMVIYSKTRMDLRKRHLMNNSKRPLKLITIKTDLEVYQRFIKWVIIQHPHIISWELLQEEVVHEYLLTLNRKHREIVRKDLQMLFKIALKKRVITHIPVSDLPTREYPIATKILSPVEQRNLTKTLREAIYLDPKGSLIGFLSFFHGLSSSQITNIKLEHIDVGRKLIHLPDRPPAYLDQDTLLALSEYVKERAKNPTSLGCTYLLIVEKFNPVRGFKDVPVLREHVRRRLFALTGYTPRVLKITCYTSFAALYGPQYLIEAFGLSLTQASRYGNFEEYLVEEEIRVIDKYLN